MIQLSNSRQDQRWLNFTRGSWKHWFTALPRFLPSECFWVACTTGKRQKSQKDCSKRAALHFGYPCTNGTMWKGRGENQSQRVGLAGTGKDAVNSLNWHTDTYQSNSTFGVYVLNFHSNHPLPTWEPEPWGWRLLSIWGHACPHTLEPKGTSDQKQQQTSFQDHEHGPLHHQSQAASYLLKAISIFFIIFNRLTVFICFEKVTCYLFSLLIWLSELCFFLLGMTFYLSFLWSFKFKALSHF